MPKLLETMRKEIQQTINSINDEKKEKFESRVEKRLTWEQQKPH